MIAGRFNRAIPMTTPGMFLSQPGMAMRPSYHWAPMTVSTLSAIKSLDCKEYRMPVVPILIPSLTPTALKRYPTMPASWHDLRIKVPSSSRCMLQGLPSYQMLPTPTNGFGMSSCVKPVA